MHKLDLWLDLAVESIVQETTDQLCGERHLETALKKSLAPQKDQQSAAVLALQVAVNPAQGTAAAGSTGKDNNNI